MHEPNIEHKVGALVFFSYIVAALFFSVFIGRDLIRLYIKCARRDQKAAWTAVEPGQWRTKVLRLTFLASVSFASLSYHMLSFLIQSYTAWARRSSVRMPERLYGIRGLFGPQSDRTALHVWIWAKQSTLFRDFAQVIIDDPRRYWWTQLALLYSFGWNLYMSVQGVKHRVPHLWAYYVLAQILPISFTQNLFCIAVRLCEKPSHSQGIGPVSTGALSVMVLAYLLCLLDAPSTLGKSIFFPIVFAIRTILVMPYWLVRYAGVSRAHSSHRPSQRRFGLTYRLVAPLVLAATAGFLQFRQTLLCAPWTSLAKPLGDNSAIAALGYDVLIGILSLGMFLTM